MSQRCEGIQIAIMKEKNILKVVEELVEGRPQGGRRLMEMEASDRFRCERGPQTGLAFQEKPSV